MSGSPAGAPAREGPEVEAGDDKYVVVPGGDALPVHHEAAAHAAGSQAGPSTVSAGSAAGSLPVYELEANAGSVPQAGSSSQRGPSAIGASPPAGQEDPQPWDMPTPVFPASRITSSKAEEARGDILPAYSESDAGDESEAVPANGFNYRPRQQDPTDWTGAPSSQFSIRRKAVQGTGDALPAYSPESFEAGPSSQQPMPGPSTMPTPTGESAEDPTNVPTVAHPFNFPTDKPPEYETSDGLRKPIAIPQIRPDPASPFAPAYPPCLLSYGITATSWHSFLDTLSAFLSAKVSDRAISHAGDVARRVGDVPKRFGKVVATRAKRWGHGVSDNAKKGNYVGAAMGVMGGIFTLPLGTAISVVGHTMALPVYAMAKKPQTPRARADAYVAAANQEWFLTRGLEARLLDTGELAELVGVAPNALLNLARSNEEEEIWTADDQLAALGGWISAMSVAGTATLELGGSTLWLVLV